MSPENARPHAWVAAVLAAITLVLAGGAAAAEPPPQFDMTIDITDNGVTVASGDTIVYTLRYENLGPDVARQVFLDVQVPEYATADLVASTPDGWQCSPIGGKAGANCVVQVGDVEGLASGVATFVVTLDETIPDGVDEIVLYAGCEFRSSDGCPAPIVSNGIFVGGSGFPETDFTNNWSIVRTTIAQDSDGDGVNDDDDLCPGTDLAGDAAPERLKQNRFWSDVDGTFGDSGFTVADTGGCSASQIIEAADLGFGHGRFGISGSALANWVARV